MNKLLRFRTLLLVGLLGAVLGGCQLPTLQVNSAVSRNTIFAAANTYGVALSIASGYKKLPLCRTGTVASPSNICAQRSIIVRMQAADARAVTAITNANNFVKKYPNLDATNVIQAAQQAIADYQAVISNSGVN